MGQNGVERGQTEQNGAIWGQKGQNLFKDVDCPRDGDHPGKVMILWMVIFLEKVTVLWIVTILGMVNILVIVTIIWDGHHQYTGPNRAQRGKSGPIGPNRGLSGPNGAKQGTMGSNGAKQGQNGLNRATRGPIGVIGLNGAKWG